MNKAFVKFALFRLRHLPNLSYPARRRLNHRAICLRRLSIAIISGGQTNFIITQTKMPKVIISPISVLMLSSFKPPPSAAITADAPIRPGDKCRQQKRKLHKRLIHRRPADLAKQNNQLTAR